MSPESVPVLCCDDVDDEELFDAQFDRDWNERRRSGERRRLVRYTAVRPSVGAAWGALTTAAKHADMPRVVLIDNHLRSAEGGFVEGAFELLRLITERFTPAERPVCILYTSRFDPCVAHAFCEQGGSHAIDKLLGWEQRLRVIWAAIDGERWQHSPSPPLVKFTPRDYAILPFLAADLSANSIARELGLSDEQVHDARRGLYGRLDEHEPRLVDFALSGQTTALAQAALRAGAVWTPLDHRVDNRARTP